jgi:hypothetical protein
LKKPDDRLLSLTPKGHGAQSIWRRLVANADVRSSAIVAQ